VLKGNYRLLRQIGDFNQPALPKGQLFNGLTVGTNDFIAKPVDLGELFPKLTKWLTL
jgi:hypothetical protein